MCFWNTSMLRRSPSGTERHDHGKRIVLVLRAHRDRRRGSRITDNRFVADAPHGAGGIHQVVNIEGQLEGLVRRGFGFQFAVARLLRGVPDLIVPVGALKLLVPNSLKIASLS